MFRLVSCVVLVQYVQSIYLNFMETSSDSALTVSGIGLTLAPHDFNNSAQLWMFDASNGLVTTSSKLLDYDSSNTTILVDVSTAQWMVEGMSIIGSKGGVELCLMSDVTTMGDCNGDTFNTLLLIQDLDLVEQLSTIDSSMKQYNDIMKETLVNISNIENELSNSALLLTSEKNSLNTYYKNLQDASDTFDTNATLALGNLDLTEKHFKEHVDTLNAGIASLDLMIANISSVINSTTFNFTKIENETNGEFQVAKVRLDDRLQFMKDEIALKSKQGHIVPASIYDFVVIFLTLLGVINVADLFRRLWLCAVNGRDVKILYAQT